MQNEPFWLSVETVTEINKVVVADSGEPHILIDEMKLEGALQRPYSLWAYGSEEDVFFLSTHYMISISEAHAYIQGNKRTGFVAGLNFLQNNGYDLSMPDHEEVAAILIAVIDRRADTCDLQNLLEPFVVELDD